MGMHLAFSIQVAKLASARASFQSRGWVLFGYASNPNERLKESALTLHVKA